MKVQSILEVSEFSIYRFTGRKCLSAVKDQYNLENCENLITIRDVSRFCERTGCRLG
jgi:hypothetical protein